MKYLGTYVALPLATIEVCPHCKSSVSKKKDWLGRIIWVCKTHGKVKPILE